MQSSNLDAARAMHNAYNNKSACEAFAAGYDHAHGIACHNVPRVGETYETESDGVVTPENADEARDMHRALCFAAEENARCFSPWEFTARELNAIECEFERESAWNAYDEGVAAAISHDLARYTDEDYTLE